MAIDYHHLKNREFPPVHQHYTERDSMLYALSLGLGNNPLDEHALAFCYEGVPGGLRALPTQAVVLGYPGFWAREPDTGIDWTRLLHGEQRLRIHRPIAAAGHVVGHTRVTRLIDKGADKGAIMVSERRLDDQAGNRLATIEQVTFLRGNGGYSTQGAGQPSDDPLPTLPASPSDRAPDYNDSFEIPHDTALLYRLSGDLNPLHADPAIARAAGFERPILHGLATYALAAHALVRQCCDHDPARLRAFDVRFSAPVYPGETLVTEIWRDPHESTRLYLRARVPQRNIEVLSRGCAECLHA